MIDKEIIKIQAHINNVLIKAVWRNDLEQVKVALTNKDIEVNANINTRNGYCLIIACKYGYIDLVKYLLSSPDLKEHSDIHALNDEPLKLAFLGKFNDILSYLIIEKNLTISDNLKLWLKEFDLENIVMSIIEKRELNKKLSTSFINYIKSTNTKI